MILPKPRAAQLFAFAGGLLLAALPALAADPTPPTKRNLVIFVADGLRYDSVNEDTAPTMLEIRKKGVDFVNSHSVYPTLTTVNASVIATGHYPGDTGNYANSLYLGVPVKCAMGSTVAFVEDDCILKDVKAAYPKDYLGQDTLLQTARKAGYNTVLVGKLGPTAIQWLGALDSKNEEIEGPLGIYMDDATNYPLNFSGLPTMSPPLGGLIANEVFGATGTGKPPLPSHPNWTQQSYLASAVTQVLIPDLQMSGKPFVMTFWSRDPDTTQHAALDSDGKIVPGINSTNAHEAIRNADNNLRAILNALKLWGLADTTDVIAIADHGFSTIGKGIPTADGEITDIGLPNGFVATDVAKWLGDKKVFDPDQSNAELDFASGDKPKFGNALIGDTVEAPQAIVVANGGSDFIYIPDSPSARDTAKTIYAQLAKQPYVGALFVNDALMQGGAQDKDFAGALPMSEVRMIGSSKVPQPAIVIGFRSFVAKGCTLGDLLCTVEIADSPLHTGQGMHGSLSRADTRNYMAAFGPSFKAATKIDTPVGNMDVAHTAARILGLTLTGPGTLKGRVIEEALKGGSAPQVTKRVIESATGPDGMKTVLQVQEVGSTRYIDAGGRPGHTVGLKTQ